MPIDYNFEVTPSFRDLTHTGLVLLKRPLVRSLRNLQRLRRGLASSDEIALVPAKIPVASRAAK